MMTVAEQIIDMLRAESPRTNRDFAVAIYGDGSINSKVKVGQRLKDLVRRGTITEERTGPEQNALVRYHLAPAKERDAVEQLREIEGTVDRLVAQIRSLRGALAGDAHA